MDDLQKISDADWRVTANKKGVRVSTLQQKDSKLHVIKTEVKLNTTLNNVLETYNTKSEWANWQPDLRQCKTIEALKVPHESTRHALSSAFSACIRTRTPDATPSPTSTPPSNACSHSHMRSLSYSRS